MSHDLEIRDGEAQAIFREVAWHRLGTVVGDNFGWAEAIAANLTVTYDVAKVPVSDLIIGHGFAAEEYAAVRSDGVILRTGLGEQWTPFQAAEGYAFGQVIRDQAHDDGLAADLRSLGTLDNGRKWFLTFDLGTFAIGDYDVRDYLSVNGSFDSSWPLQVLTSPIVEVCANTVAFARATGIQHYRFKHTSGIFDRVEEAKRALRRHRANREAFKAVGDRLVATKVSKVDYVRLLDALFPTDDDTPTRTRNANEEAKDVVTDLYKATAGVPSLVSEPGNGWAFVQSVNTYENWGTPVRKTGGNDTATTRALRQVEQLASGKQPLTDKAVDLLLA
jgi:phage/plasmid-like protein (TIGR03299 family)